MKRLLLILALLAGFTATHAQDTQYSQFYSAPLFLNPAFTGSTELTRVGMNYRMQWPGLQHSFNSYSVYADHYSFDLNSGFGLLIHANNETNARLKTIDISALYSYNLQLSDGVNFRFGGQAGYVSRNAYFEGLVFGDQLNVNTGQAEVFTEEMLGAESQRRFVNFSVGALAYTDVIWAGASVHHLTQPNQSFYENGALSRLPMKISAHVGGRIDLQGGYRKRSLNYSFQERSLFFAGNFKAQGPYNQLDIGAQVYLEPVAFGLWYRGIPVKNALPNNESIVLVTGFTLPNGIDIGYSYDMVVSKLGMSTGGAHEFSMRYQFMYGSAKDRNLRRTILPCFRF
ncbi:PorP/SprF family type IX secretion system membrane protein [Penaeicola halotolerans]|uniref:PorP/SprF family type IX secretion system membrane protein n=1 Tax=Penaeicola halotolerans TaxID=2793196 RepID=UPI001CF86C78|nr:type IX secretion system membrane protein PorP/SprF [Penaeicola halotolerans]